MTRLFFDVVGPNVRAYDFVGRYFSDTKDAYEDAEILSLDLSCTDNADFQAAEVQVRNNSGEQLFALALKEPK